MAEGKILHGKAAIAAVEKVEGKLTPIQRHVVSLEGYSTGDYDDTKGISTGGVGQVGLHKGKPFKEVFAIFEEQARNTISGYDSLPLYLRKELVQSAYRGDLGLSPNTVKLFNKGSFSDASKEFLINNEYVSEKAKEKDGKTSHIAKRMKATSNAIDRYGKELGEAAVSEEFKNPDEVVADALRVVELPPGTPELESDSILDRDYIVRAGDTLSKIAREQGVDREQIGGLRDAKKRGLIYPGDILTLPPEQKDRVSYPDPVSERIYNIMKPRN